MSKPKTPQYQQLTAPTVQTGSQLYNQGVNFAQQNGLGYTLNAQGNALQEAQSPGYYNSFQPSSFSQALANQSFANIWPNEQAAIQQQQSETGQAYSPGSAEATGNAYGNLATGIGEYLNQQGMQEANTGIQAGLSINPNEVIGPYTQTAANQGNLQNSYDFQTQQANNSADYANALAKYNQQVQSESNIIKGAASLFGPVGYAVGTIGTGMMGLGQMAGSQLNGSQNSMAPYMQAMQYYNNSGAGNPASAGIPYDNSAYNSAINSLPTMASTLSSSGAGGAGGAGGASALF